MTPQKLQAIALRIERQRSLHWGDGQLLVDYVLTLEATVERLREREAGGTYTVRHDETPTNRGVAGRQEGEDE